MSIYDYTIVYGERSKGWEENRATKMVVCARRIQMFRNGHYDGPSREYKRGPPIISCMLCDVETNDYSSISFSNKSKVICGECRNYISTVKSDVEVDGYDSEEEGKAEDAMGPKDDFDRFREAVLAGQTETVFSRFVQSGSFIPGSRIKREYLHGKDLEKALECDRLYETLTVEQYEALNDEK